MSRWPHKIAAILPRLELLVLAAAAPFLLFPATRPRWTAVALGLVGRVLPAAVDRAGESLGLRRHSAGRYCSWHW